MEGIFFVRGVLTERQVSISHDSVSAFFFMLHIRQDKKVHNNCTSAADAYITAFPFSVI